MLDQLFSFMTQSITRGQLIEYGIMYAAHRAPEIMKHAPSLRQQPPQEETPLVDFEQSLKNMRNEYQSPYHQLLTDWEFSADTHTAQTSKQEPQLVLRSSQNWVEIIEKRIQQQRVCIISEGNNIEFIKKACEFFGVGNVEFETGIRDKSGASQLNAVFQYHASSHLLNKKKYLIVWDADQQNRKPQKYKATNNTYPYVLPINPNNKYAWKGIENLFPEHLLCNFVQRTNYANGEEEVKFDTNRENKKRFAVHILTRDCADDYVLFKPLVEEIQRIQKLPFHE